MVDERDVEGYLRQGVEALGFKCIKYSNGEAGMPDRLILLPEGRCIWVELKRPGGRLSSLQHYQHSRLSAVGQRVEIVWNKHDADQLLKELSLIDTE